MGESRRDLFPDLEPTNDNFPLYQSFLEKYKLGMILNETMRMKYYNTLFPAMDAMRCTLSNNSRSYADIVSDANIEDRTESVSNVDEVREQVLASSINNNKETIVEEDEYEYDDESDDEEEEKKENQDEESEYEYEYEYEYETDDEFDEGDDAQKDAPDKK